MNWLDRLLGKREVNTTEQFSAGVSKEALKRREANNLFLQSRGVAFNTWLPCIEDSTEVALRTAAETLDRAICLMAVATAAVENERAAADRIIDAWGLRPALTPLEWAFLEDGLDDENSRNVFSWQFEAMVVLFWALGLIKAIPRPDSPTDLGEKPGLLDADPELVRAAAAMRPVGEILDQADLYYRLHNVARDAFFRGTPSPAGLNLDVVMERHRALNWLIRYGDADWDEVATDT